MSECQPAVTYRDVSGFPGYRVGDDGSVWSCRKPGYGYGRIGEWKRLKADPDKAGRPVVSLRRGGKTFRMLVCWIVAMAFIGPRPVGLLVCHDNGNPGDNRPKNLKYGTYKDNEDDKARHGRKLLGDRHPVAKLTPEKVGRIKAALASEPSRGLIAKLAREHGVDGAIIARIRDGKAWTWVVSH
jgi:hypothetical protein